MSDIQNDVEKQAEEALKRSDDQHFGDAMDDADAEPEGPETSESEKKRRLA